MVLKWSPAPPLHPRLGKEQLPKTKDELDPKHELFRYVQLVLHFVRFSFGGLSALRAPRKGHLHCNVAP